jgi:hypothetical protein
MIATGASSFPLPPPLFPSPPSSCSGLVLISSLLPTPADVASRGLGMFLSHLPPLLTLSSPLRGLRGHSAFLSAAALSSSFAFFRLRDDGPAHGLPSSEPCGACCIFETSMNVPHLLTLHPSSLFRFSCSFFACCTSYSSISSTASGQASLELSQPPTCDPSTPFHRPQYLFPLPFFFPA